MNPHVDVASYALGVLGEPDASRFEAHLADCDLCADELESLLPVVGALAQARGAGPAAAAPAVRLAERRQRRTARAAARERKPSPGRNLLGIAATTVLAAGLAGGGVLAGAQWFAPEPGAPTQAAPPAPATQPAPVAGERLSAVDRGTGVQADVLLEGRPWGTKVSFAVSKVSGPLTCRLVAVRASGQSEVLSTWTVPPTGYGTQEQPQPLALEASTALTRRDIVELQVQSVDISGNGTPLVTVQG